MRWFKRKIIEDKFYILSDEIDKNVYKIFTEYNLKRRASSQKTMCLNIDINGYRTFNIFDTGNCNLWVSFKSHDTIILYNALSIMDRLEIYKQLKIQL